MERLGIIMKSFGVWIVMISPWGRDWMLKRTRINAIAEGQFLLAKQLANMNRERRRAALRTIVKNFKKRK